MFSRDLRSSFDEKIRKEINEKEWSFDLSNVYDSFLDKKERSPSVKEFKRLMIDILPKEIPTKEMELEKVLEGAMCIAATEMYIHQDYIW